MLSGWFSTTLPKMCWYHVDQNCFVTFDRHHFAQWVKHVSNHKISNIHPKTFRRKSTSLSNGLALKEHKTQQSHILTYLRGFDFKEIVLHGSHWPKPCVLHFLFFIVEETCVSAAYAVVYVCCHQQYLFWYFLPRYNTQLTVIFFYYNYYYYCYY